MRNTKQKYRVGRGAVASVVALLALMTAGCGGPYDATVYGAVTLDGQPLPSGTVSFFPTSDGPTAYSRIDDSGMYQIRTGREKGLPPGEYAVTVVAREKPTVDQSNSGGPPPAGRMLTPQRYRNRDQSGLVYTVEPGANQIDLELTSQPPAG
ncbi:hypothetical protein Mal64_34890 [Pseudobythopirellula maris]|uniref:Carboxypeptidase regulatory-like domain-containing protein n=1 Tax=Pseudobythopirellula maris TaxID=2527991 RepID=A0A5C5ZHR1_9BACT|nr:carboxypeptidase-like regulatory domain-containing protein [Pseudobythopirellula maris]TWT86660.1 hypothetical protein Mal64_34890 [Pseudobythopirellula maris]